MALQTVQQCNLDIMVLNEGRNLFISLNKFLTISYKPHPCFYFSLHTS